MSDTPPADESYQPDHGPWCCTPTPADEWCCDHSCDNCSGIGPASCINHRPHHPPADVCSTCKGSGVWTDGVHDDACPECGPHTPPAAVCEGCDHDPHDPGLCIATIPFRGDDEARVTCDCGGTGDRPAVTDTETVLREVLSYFAVEGHPGRPCLRTSWVHVETVDRWRAALEAADATRQEQP